MTMSVVSARTAEHYRWGHDCDGWHLVTSDHLSVIQERMPPNRAETRHYHERAEQFFFVLAGIATMDVDGEVFTVHPHHGIHVKPDTPHRISNQQSSDLVFTVTSTPPSHGDRVEL
jgi:mannose-6-phosphate isomerase-like protein (cupin superfamily)